MYPLPGTFQANWILPGCFLEVSRWIRRIRIQEDPDPPGKFQDSRDLPGNFQANRIFPGLSGWKLPGRCNCIQDLSRKDPGRKLAWISGYPSWKFPGRMPGGKVPFSRFHRVFLDPSWKVPGNILDPSRKFPGWRRPFLQNKVVLWFCGDLKTGSFLDVYWKDAVFRTFPVNFLEVCCSTGRISSRIRSDFRRFGNPHISGNFQEGCR